MKRENLSAGQHSQIGIWRLARGGEEKRFHFEPISISKKRKKIQSQPIKLENMDHCDRPNLNMFELKFEFEVGCF